MLTPIHPSRLFHRRIKPEVEAPVINISASSVRSVPSLVLAFDSESGSTWKGPVVPNAQTAGTHLRSSVNVVNSLSVPTMM